MKTLRKHSGEFRFKAVKQVLAGETAAHVAKSINISKGLLHYWVRRSNDPAFFKPPAYNPFKEKVPDRVARFAKVLWQSEVATLGESVPSWEESSVLWSLIARDAALRLRRVMTLWKHDKLHKLLLAFCAQCHQAFRPRKNGGKKYCSITCYTAAKPLIERRRALSLPRCKGCGRRCLTGRCPGCTIYKKTCGNCGKTFRTKTRYRANCSQTCITEWRRRHPVKFKFVTRVPCLTCHRGKTKKRSHSDFCARCDERTISRYPELRSIKDLNHKLRKLIQGGENGA